MHMERSLAAGQWKPGNTAGNHVVSQRDMGGVAQVRPLHALEPHIVAHGTFAGMLNECLRHDGREDQEIAAAIHISKGYLSKLLRSAWSAQAKRLIDFMRETRCVAPLQWLADQMGFELREKKTAVERERDELLARLAAIDGRAAA